MVAPLASALELTLWQRPSIISVRWSFGVTGKGTTRVLTGGEKGFPIRDGRVRSGVRPGEPVDEERTGRVGKTMSVAHMVDVAAVLELPRRCLVSTGSAVEWA